MVYQPITEGYFEVKPGWLDENNKPKYDKLPFKINSIDWDKRSDTVAKIYKDEFLPFFLNQNLTDLLKFKPIDNQRYYFSLRLVKKYKPTGCEIIEEFPKTITLMKHP